MFISPNKKKAVEKKEIFSLSQWHYKNERDRAVNIKKKVIHLTHSLNIRAVIQEGYKGKINIYKNILIIS